MERLSMEDGAEGGERGAGKDIKRDLEIYAPAGFAETYSRTDVNAAHNKSLVKKSCTYDRH
jgi:hypothetical protein